MLSNNSKETKKIFICSNKYLKTILFLKKSARGCSSRLTSLEAKRISSILSLINEIFESVIIIITTLHPEQAHPTWQMGRTGPNEFRVSFQLKHTNFQYISLKKVSCE